MAGKSWLDHPNAWSASVDYTGAQTNATVYAAQSGWKTVITWVMISNGAVAGNVTLLDGSGGTVLYEVYPQINGGVAQENIQIELTAETLLAVTSTDCTTHSVNVGGFLEPA